MILGIAAALFTADPALAQDPGDFTIQPEILLASAPGYRSNGVGAPSVVWDPDQSRYLMVFEVRLPDVAAECPAGKWGLGLATSTDGLNWFPGPTALFEPAAGSFYSCVAAHPTAVYDNTARALYVFFKSEQGTDACDVATPSWGCTRYTGVGRLRVGFDDVGNPTRLTVRSTPVVDIDIDMGFPKFVNQGSTKYILLSRRPDVFVASSPVFSDFSLDPDPVITPGLVTWGQDEMFNPSVVCQDSISFPLASYPGGRNLDGFSILGAGWGKALASTPSSWFLGASPYFEWSDDDQWRHWEVSRLSTGEYLVYFSEKDASGNPRIRLATTTPSWAGVDIAGKSCP